MNEPRIQPFTLRLDDGALEREFLDRYYDQSILLVRIGLMMGLFLYSSFGLLDIVAVPTRLKEIWFLRFGIACPVIAILLVWSFHSSFRKFSQIATLVLGVIGSGVIVAMTVIAPPPTNHLYQTGVIAVLMFISSVMRLRFVYTVSTALIVILGYNVVALADGKTAAWIVVNHNFFLFTAMIIGGFSAYGVEIYARRNFLQSRTIASRSEELEKKNDALSEANRELLESRALILESSRRAQLIFSALAEALPGTTLDDKYEIGERIGSGGFATVYRGKHLLLDAPVAIKIFRPSSAKDLEKSFERFRLEGISAKKINHPNAVEILDFGIAGSAIAFLVMELLEGHTLADEIRAHGRRSPRRAAEIIVPVCSVLAEAHRLGIIHRDIKPGNIFLHRSPKGEIVKVVDFGIAKVTEQSTTPIVDELTATGALIGTPSYMAPERFDRGIYGFSSDIYSVGVLLFQMLTGELPARSRNESGRLRDIPPELADLIVRALASEPEGRPTAYEMASTIATIFDLPVSVTAPGAPRTPRLTLTDVPTEVRSVVDSAVTEVSDRESPTRTMESEVSPAEVPRRLRGSE